MLEEFRVPSLPPAAPARSPWTLPRGGERNSCRDCALWSSREGDWRCRLLHLPYAHARRCWTYGMPVLPGTKVATVASFIRVIRIRRSRIRTVIDGVTLHFAPQDSPRDFTQSLEPNTTAAATGRSVKFDKCFPREFQAKTVEAHVGQYWDLHTTRRRTRGQIPPAKIRIFAVDDLNTQSGQRAISGDFCGLRQPVFRSVNANAQGDDGRPDAGDGLPMSDQWKSEAGRVTSQDIEHQLVPAHGCWHGHRSALEERSAPADAVSTRSEAHDGAKPGKRSGYRWAPGRAGRRPSPAAASRPGSGSDRQSRPLHLHLRARWGSRC